MINLIQYYFTAQARLATANDELRQLNKSNSDIRALITELHISISDQKTQNQEINETLQETKESFEKSEAQILLLKSKVDEAIGNNIAGFSHVDPGLKIRIVYTFSPIQR